MTSSCHVYLRSTVFGILYNLHLHNVFLYKWPWGGARVSPYRELSNLSYVNPPHCEHWAQARPQHSICPCIIMERHMASKTSPHYHSVPLHLFSCLSLAGSLAAGDTEEENSTLNYTQARLNILHFICFGYSLLLTNWLLPSCCVSTENNYLREAGGFVYCQSL